MTLTLWDRVKVWVCEHFGHSEVRSKYCVTCKRCRRLLKGPLQMMKGEA